MLSILLILASSLQAPIYFATTLDGQILAMDRDAKLLWSYSTGFPFLQTYYSENTSQNDNQVYIPTPHGELISAQDQKFTKSYKTIQELVESSPIITSNRITIGEKRARAYAFEIYTGNLIAEFSNSASVTYTDNYMSDDIVVISVVEYSYQVLDTRSMEPIWNMTYTTLLAPHSDTVDVNHSQDFFENKFAGSLVTVGSYSQGKRQMNLLVTPQIEDKAMVRLSNVGGGLFAEILPMDYRRKFFEKNLYELEYIPKLPMIEGKEIQKSSDVMPSVLLFVISIVIPRVFKSNKRQVLKKEASIGTSSYKIKEPILSEYIIGKIQIFPQKILGTGSQGTIVYEGLYQQRPVAIKRLQHYLYDEARQEMEMLLKADIHPNVVTFYGFEQDQSFVYLALEKCKGSIQNLVDKQQITNKAKRKKAYQLFPDEIDKIKLLTDAAEGLAFLHKNFIVHRDIKPMNILINYQNRAMIADMASGKQLFGDESFKTNHIGSLGWQPAEVINFQRKSFSVDIFSLGCTFYYCLTGGLHPFGARAVRDANILNDNYDIDQVDIEQQDLIQKMIRYDAQQRPSIGYVLNHCMFWDTIKQIEFIKDFSDFIQTDTSFDIDLELDIGGILKSGWDVKLDQIFLDNISKFRKYNYVAIKDLLRVFRNKHSHYDEMPDDLKTLFQPFPINYFCYF